MNKLDFEIFFFNKYNLTKKYNVLSHLIDNRKKQHEDKLYWDLSDISDDWESKNKWNDHYGYIQYEKERLIEFVNGKTKYIPYSDWQVNSRVFQFLLWKEEYKKYLIQIKNSVKLIHHWLKHAYYRPEGPGYLKAITF